MECSNEKNVGIFRYDEVKEMDLWCLPAHPSTRGNRYRWDPFRRRPKNRQGLGVQVRQVGETSWVQVFRPCCTATSLQYSIVLVYQSIWQREIKVTCSFFGGVQVGFLLSFADVLLVANPFVSKPIGNLRNGDATFTSQLFLSLFARVRIAEMWVEIFIQNFWSLFAEVATFPPTNIPTSKRWC